MPRIVALDFDSQAAQVVVVERRPTGTSVRLASQFQLDDDAGTYSPEQLAERVGRELGSLKLSGAKVVVLVGGDDVQYRLIELPPAPLADLPDMVRFQAVREFAAADEDSPLDFLPLRGDEAVAHQVLAARLRAVTSTRAREMCEGLDLELARLVPRGVSLAAACKRLMPELASGKHLIAAPVGNQLEMVLLRDGEVILLRRARVTGEQASDAAVLGELRRTVAAAAAQLEGPVESAVLIGDKLPLVDSASESTSWGRLVSLDLSKLLRDWGVTAPPQPSESARLAAVLEAALMEAERTAPALDFANPRQRIVVETPKRTRILGGVAAATVVIAGGFYLFNQLWSLDRETVRLNALAAEQRTALERFEPYVERAAALEKWLATDVTWLDELDRATLALRPKPLDDPEYAAEADVLVKSIRTRRPDLNATGGILELDTLAKNSDALNPLEDRLRDERHDVGSGNIGRESGDGEYSLSVKYDVTVEPATANPRKAAK
ncbi:MAG: hypothetical protein WD851_08900 [Pirellulales bacterium]